MIMSDAPSIESVLLIQKAWRRFNEKKWTRKLQKLDGDILCHMETETNHKLRQLRRVESRKKLQQGIFTIPQQQNYFIIRLLLLLLLLLLLM